MNSDLYQFLNDWVLHVLVGVLIAAFSYLTGQRRAEKVSMTVKDCDVARKNCRDLLKVEREKDDEILNQKLLRIEERVESVEGKVDSICGKMDSLRGMVTDYFRHQGFRNRRRNLDSECNDGPGSEGEKAL